MQYTVEMTQLSKYQWQIRSKKGFIVQDNLCFNSKVDAEAYVKAYISSYLNWTYEMVTS